MSGEGVASVEGCIFIFVKVNIHLKTIHQVFHHLLMSQQSRMVPLASFCLGLHPLVPLGTGSTMTVVEVTVDMRMSMVALLIPTVC